MASPTAIHSNIRIPVYIIYLRHTFPYTHLALACVCVCCALSSNYLESALSYIYTRAHAAVEGRERRQAPLSISRLLNSSRDIIHALSRAAPARVAAAFFTRAHKSYCALLLLLLLFRCTAAACGNGNLRRRRIRLGELLFLTEIGIFWEDLVGVFFYRHN